MEHNGFGHLKTGLFTIKALWTCRFWGAMVCIYMYIWMCQRGLEPLNDMSPRKSIVLGCEQKSGPGPGDMPKDVSCAAGRWKEKWQCMDIRSNHEVSSLFFLLLLEECLEYFYVLLLLLYDNYEIKLKRFGSKIIVKLCPGSAKLKRPYLGSMPAFGIFWATPCHPHWVGLRLYQLLWVVALVHPIRIPCNILCDMIWCLILFLSSSRSLVKKKKAEEMYLGFYAIVHHWLDVSMKNT